jgi:hypothetical protein
MLDLGLIIETRKEEDDFSPACALEEGIKLVKLDRLEEGVAYLRSAKRRFIEVYINTSDPAILDNIERCYLFMMSATWCENMPLNYQIFREREAWRTLTRQE